MVGEVLVERYELEELVGTGGMSSVYRARDRLLERTVALKVLHERYAEDGDYVERFRHEARAVASLAHPNIVTVIDRGEQGGRQFIVFEYVEGDNLKQLIDRRGPAPVDTALELGAQIARALAFAHANGLVHRDVKPQNVLLNGDGQAKVTDFGIARSLDVQHGMTQTGTVLGTSDYLAPEQAQGQRVDEHSDIYSLGVVLFELLTSHVPFPAENFVAVAMRHINEPPPPIRTERPDVPSRVEAAVQRAMAKDPQDRFHTMADFQHELEACLAEVRGTQVLAPPPAAPPRPRPRRGGVSPWPFVVALVVLLAAGGVGAYFLLHRHSNGSPGSHGTIGPGLGTVHFVSATAYDPYGHPPGQENNAQAHLAIDGDPNTAWSTETYYSSFAALHKPGVGLVLDAGRSLHLTQLGFATSTPGFVAEIKAGNSAGGPFDHVVGASQTATGQTRYQIAGGASYRYYLIWITRLPPSYQHASINEVDATG